MVTIYAAKVRNGFVPRLRREVWRKAERFGGRGLLVCQPTREETNSVGVNSRGIAVLRMAEAAAGG